MATDASSHLNPDTVQLLGTKAPVGFTNKIFPVPTFSLGPDTVDVFWAHNSPQKMSSRRYLFFSFLITFIPVLQALMWNVGDQSLIFPCAWCRTWISIFLFLFPGLRKAPSLCWDKSDKGSCHFPFLSFAWVRADLAWRGFTSVNPQWKCLLSAWV